MSRNRSNRRKRKSKPQRPATRRLVDILLSLAILAGLAAVTARMSAISPTGSLEGYARIVDGDSLEMGGESIRLHGIDAPELFQTCTRNGADYPCGREAQAALTRLIAGRTVHCENYGRDRYDRMLARCEAGETVLNRKMVETGWALAYGEYEAEERAAKQAKRGIWQGTFTRPQEWRRNHGGNVEPQHDWVADFWRWLSSLIGF